MRIHMLVGPPGAGKTTMVANERGPNDCQVDIDLIPRHHPQKHRLAIRRELLFRAARAQTLGTCWFSTAAPRRSQRSYWRNLVPIHRTTILLPPLELALKRQIARDGPNSSLTPRVSMWYDLFEYPDEGEENTCVIRIEEVCSLHGE